MSSNAIGLIGGCPPAGAVVISRIRSGMRDSSTPAVVWGLALIEPTFFTAYSLAGSLETSFLIGPRFLPVAPAVGPGPLTGNARPLTHPATWRPSKTGAP